MNKKNKRKYKNTVFKHKYNLMDLYKAYWECRKKKRSSQSAIEFEYNLESNMLKLYEDLKSGNYQIGKSICFVVLKPKPREIWAASFRDRIVHHLVYNAIKDRFLSHFIQDTFSCIPKRGTLKAGKQAAKYAQAITENNTKKAYYLKADIKNFFVSIDKRILYELVIERVPEKWLQELIAQIIFNDPKTEAIIQSPDWKFEFLPEYKSLWNCSPDKGLPIGNLTSQFFSNVYLNKLDQFVKHKLRCKYYCRYVDDFIIMDELPQNLNYYYEKISEFIKTELELELHKNKKTINLVSNGIDFVGYKIKPNRMYLRSKTVRNIFRLADEYQKGVFDIKEEEIEELFSVFNSYLGQLRSVKGYNLRKKLCGKIAYPFFQNDEEFTKIKKMYIPQKYWKYLGIKQ
ncbi:MAG: RNA-directed DNA polymerase [bacterium]|nr:RNA-directed DNA polymerase [bacterium]